MGASKDLPNHTPKTDAARLQPGSAVVDQNPNATRGSAAPTALVDVAWEVLWLRISALPWRSLVLVPSGGSHHARHAMGLLHTAALQHLGYPLERLDATVERATTAVETLATFRHRQGPQRMLVAVHEPTATPHAVAVARAADVAVLVIPLGSHGTQSARLVMDLVGTHRFVGCITMDASGRGRYA